MVKCRCEEVAMKHLVIALALLTGEAKWVERTDEWIGMFCPTLEDAERIANTYHQYTFSGTVARTRCQLEVLNGQQTGETDAFSIGGTLYTFLIIDVDGYEVYLLNEIGDGYTA